MIIRRKLLLFISIFSFSQLISWLIRQKLDGYVYAKFVRITMLINIEFFTLIGTYLIWCRVSNLLKKLFHAHSRVIVDVFKSLLLFFFLCTHCCLILYYVLLSEEPHWLAIISFISLGLFLHLFAFSLGFALLEYAISLFKLQAAENSHLLVKCMCSKDFHTVLTIVFSIVLTSVSIYSASLPPIVKERTIFLKNLAPEFDGFKISLLTDVHIGPTVGRSRVQQIAHVSNTLDPDLVAIVGDLTDGSLAHLQSSVEPLKLLKAKHGVVYATGNHEYYHGNIDQWMQHFPLIGIHPLHNSNRKVYRGTERYICVAGVDDITAKASKIIGHGMNLSLALNGCDRREIIILLAHQPNAAKKLLNSPDGSALNLVLSGHTHGGQLYVVAPFSYLTNAYYLGLYQHQSGAFVYVSAGVNYWGPPLKMYGFNEVTLITLKTDKL